MTTMRRPLTESEREARRAEQRKLVAAAIEQLRSSVAAGRPIRRWPVFRRRYRLDEASVIEGA